MPSASSRTTLFDSGRVPLWFRIPALAFGIFAVWLAAAISAHHLFGVNLGLDFKAAHGSFLLGAIAALLIGVIWIYVWFLQLRVFFDAGPQEVTVTRRGYLRWHEQRISLAGCRRLQVRCVSGVFGARSWSLTVQFADGQDKLVVELYRLSDAEVLRERLAAAMGLPVEQQVLPPVGLRETSVPALLGRAVGGVRHWREHPGDQRYPIVQGPPVPTRAGCAESPFGTLRRVCYLRHHILSRFSPRLERADRARVAAKAPAERPRRTPGNRAAAATKQDTPMRSGGTGTGGATRESQPRLQAFPDGRRRDPCCRGTTNKM